MLEVKENHGGRDCPGKVPMGDRTEKSNRAFMLTFLPAEGIDDVSGRYLPADNRGVFFGKDKIKVADAGDPAWDDCSGMLR